MKIEYDPETDAAFIWFVSDPQHATEGGQTEVWPPELDDHVGLLLSSDRRLLGIEVLFASARLPQDLLAGVSSEDS